MESRFITRIGIKKVRHLENFEIDICDTERKHLMLTGKNGCGKTSVLNAVLACFAAKISGRLNKFTQISNEELSLTLSIFPEIPNKKLENLSIWNYPAVRSLKVEKSSGINDQITNYLGSEFMDILPKFVVSDQM